jgi:hypothetical protein
MQYCQIGKLCIMTDKILDELERRKKCNDDEKHVDFTNGFSESECSRIISIAHWIDDADRSTESHKRTLHSLYNSTM